jgi:hypothetical protein
LGDVLLAIDGESVSGPHGLRDFIRAERIGSIIEIRLLREGTIRNASLRTAAGLTADSRWFPPLLPGVRQFAATAKVASRGWPP